MATLYSSYYSCDIMTKEYEHLLPTPVSEGGLITNNQSNDSQVTNSTQDIRTSSVNKKQSFIVN